MPCHGVFVNITNLAIGLKRIIDNIKCTARLHLHSEIVLECLLPLVLQNHVFAVEFFVSGRGKLQACLKFLSIHI